MTVLCRTCEDEGHVMSSNEAGDEYLMRCPCRPKCAICKDTGSVVNRGSNEDYFYDTEPCPDCAQEED